MFIFRLFLYIFLIEHFSSMMSQKSAYRASLRRRGAIRRQQLTRGSSAQPLVLPDSLAENPVGAETLDSDDDSPS